MREYNNFVQKYFETVFSGKEIPKQQNQDIGLIIKNFNLNFENDFQQ